MPVVHGTPTVLAAPEGYEVDFANPQRQAVPAAYWIAGVGTVLTLLLLGQRLYTKIVFVGKFQLDDVFLVLAWVISTIVVAFCVHMFASVAGGVHGWEISIQKYNIFLLDVYLAAAIYIVGGSCAKISLLIFYLRLSPQQWFRIANWATLVFICGYTVGIFFALIFACKPIAMSWDVRITTGTCINRASLYIATAAVNIISDVILFILPLPIVCTLQIPRRQKVGLLFIFVLGSLTIVTSIIRVTILPQMLTSPDQTWVISWASVWIIVEANLLVICASLPTLRKFCRHVAPWLVGESSSCRASSNNRQQSSGNPPGLRTIGMISTAENKKGSHNKYSRFDMDDDSPADNDASFRMEAYPTDATLDAHQHRIQGDERSWIDDGSERAIIDVHKNASTGHSSERNP